jgi:hypothetical protein
VFSWFLLSVFLSVISLGVEAIFCEKMGVLCCVEAASSWGVCWILSPPVGVSLIFATRDTPSMVVPPHNDLVVIWWWCTIFYAQFFGKVDQSLLIDIHCPVGVGQI